MPDSNAIPRKPSPDAEPGWLLRLEERLGLLGPVQLQVFRSFGTPDALRLWGRVIERKAIAGTTAKSSALRNILDMLHRLESNEIPGARVRAHFAGRTWDTTSDEDGYFVLHLALSQPLPPGWHEVTLELVESLGEPARRREPARVLVPSPDADFAVVSDIDDTIVLSHSTDFFREAAILFGDGPGERVVFPGVPAFYRALERGAGGRGHNPFFYVSRSGWNIYDLFVEFFVVNRIPEGPLFLRDLRVIEKPSAVMGTQHHKFEITDLLLRTYPELPFILVDDSGMHDPELYANIVKAHPGRVRAIYIHDVSSDGRDQEVEGIARSLTGTVPMLRVENAGQAAEHACEKGWITREGVEEVRREVEARTSGRKR